MVLIIVSLVVNVLYLCDEFTGYLFFFFFKQKTAYELRISDWSSDVCSSDLVPAVLPGVRDRRRAGAGFPGSGFHSAHGGRQRRDRRRSRRSEERRVGIECVSTCRSRWSTSH